jgi:cyclomaltodextrinase
MEYTVFDCFSTLHKNPFGALKVGETCTFTLRLPKSFQINELALSVTFPGEKDRYIPFSLVREEGDFALSSCSFTPSNTGLHFYSFIVNASDNPMHIKRKGVSEGAFDGTEPFVLLVYDKDFQTPDWLKGGILYQIFPDRFSKGSHNRPPVPLDRKFHQNWYDIPDWQPDEYGVIRNNDYFGGTLNGIREKIPYLKSLGVTAIYLNPIFEAHENHRYGTASYERIDPMLGTTEDFKELCAQAKQAGIRVILDGVFSHTGADSVYFNKFGRYGEHSGAYRDPNSPYREWYKFIQYPNEYESWWGITTLPNVNENNPAYTRYICGENGILQKWISLGASGWRLDVADELPDEFLDNIRKSVKAMGEDNVLYGEVWEDAATKESYGVRRRYLTGNQLDSVMNYPFKDAILNYIKHGDAKAFTDSILTILEHYPKPCTDILMNFLSTHDTQRAITYLAGEEVGLHDRAWQAEKSLSDSEYAYGVMLLRCAMVLQYFLPGVPSIYYGDEAGVEGYKDPFNRRTYPWGRENTDLLAFVQKLGDVRRHCVAFREGTLRFLQADNEVCVFTREDTSKKMRAVVYLNRTKNSKILSLPREDVKHTVFLTDTHEEGGRVSVPPFGYAVAQQELI